MKQKLTIGIDLGGSLVKAGLVAPNGDVLSRLMEPSRVKGRYEAVIAQLVDVATRLRHEAQAPPSAIGLGVAGLLDANRRRVLATPNCPALIGGSIADDLSAAVGLPVTMDNDANLMALGEGATGAARERRHYVAITLGTGVGGAVISDGRLIRGWRGGGGELGHIPIAERGPKCGCGARGCLEAFIGQAGIERYIKRRIPWQKGVSLKELNLLARQGNQDAAALFAYIGRTLAVALAGFVNLFNPELIVIGGGVAEAGELLFRPLEEELHRRAFKIYLDGLTVRPAQLGNWAGVVGAGWISHGETK